MQQITRHKTFETNSSSMHSLILVDEKTYKDWENNELWFRPNTDSFYTKQEIIESDAFKYENPNYDELNELEKIKAFDDYMREFSDTDYAEFYSCHYIDKASQEVYTKDGEKKIAFSYYISG